MVRVCASYDSAVYLVCVLWALRAHVNLFVYLFFGHIKMPCPVLLYVAVCCWVCVGTFPVVRWTESVALLGSDPPYPH
jgi:hypothetical protein